MSVPTTNQKHVYNGDGSTHHWAFTFPVQSASDVRLKTVSAAGVETPVEADYTVSLAGSVTYPQSYEDDPGTGAAPPAAGTEVIVYRAVPQTQEVDLQNQANLRLAVVEALADKQTMMIQDLAEQVNRAAKFPMDQTPTASDTDTFLSEAENSKDLAAASAVAAQQAAAAVTAFWDAGKGAAKGTLDELRLAAASDPTEPFLAICTDLQQVLVYSGEPTWSNDGFIVIGG